MATIIIISENDYPAIVDWESDGAPSCDVKYEIVSDSKIAGLNQAVSKLKQEEEDAEE
jgi:hypothetical protein